MHSLHGKLYFALWVSCSTTPGQSQKDPSYQPYFLSGLNFLELVTRPIIFLTSSCIHIPQTGHLAKLSPSRLSSTFFYGDGVQEVLDTTNVPLPHVVPFLRSPPYTSSFSPFFLLFSFPLLLYTHFSISSLLFPLGLSFDLVSSHPLESLSSLHPSVSPALLGELSIVSLQYPPLSSVLPFQA